MTREEMKLIENAICAGIDEAMEQIKKSNPSSGLHRSGRDAIRRAVRSKLEKGNDEIPSL